MTTCLLTDPAMQAEVAERRSVQWVARSLRRDLTLAEQALVCCVVAMARCGPYDLPGWDTRLRTCGPRGARFSVEGWRGPATVDNDGLTRLVLQALDLGVRASLEGCGGNRLELQVHLRASRTGSLMQRCPTPEQALDSWRGRDTTEGNG